MLAHGLHYSVLGAGLLGLFVLLGPHLIAPVRHRPYDAHTERVQALRRQLAPGATDAAILERPVTIPATPVGRLLLPLAVVSSAAAAGVHAALGPAHLKEQTLFGIFFAISALLQLIWAVAVAIRPTRATLVAGAVGNLGIVALWLATRTVGLPWGLLPGPEAVGSWDLTCALWELAVVVASVLTLQSGESRPRLAAWASWSPAARSWAVGSATVLVLLSLSGAGS